MGHSNVYHRVCRKMLKQPRILPKVFSHEQWSLSNRPDVRFIPVRLVVSKNKNGSRSIQAEYLQAEGRENIRAQLKKYGKGDAKLGKKLLDDALPSLEIVSSDFTEMLIKIEKFTSNSVKLSSGGVWKVGGVIDDFYKKYSKKSISFPTIFNVLDEWFVGRIGMSRRSQSEGTQTNRTYWKQVYLFYKLYDYEQISSPLSKWFFEDVAMLGQTTQLIRAFGALNVYNSISKEYVNVKGYDAFSAYVRTTIEESKLNDWYDKDKRIVKINKIPAIKRDSGKKWTYESHGTYVHCPDES